MFLIRTVVIYCFYILQEEGLVPTKASKEKAAVRATEPVTAEAGAQAAETQTDTDRPKAAAAASEGEKPSNEFEGDEYEWDFEASRKKNEEIPTKEAKNADGGTISL